MSQLVTVSEQLRSRAPELARSIASVNVATEDSERERVFRFRYSIYIEELGRGVGTIDVRRGWLRDPEDEEDTTTILFTAADDGAMTGTARIRCWSRRAAPPDVRERFAMHRFPGLDRMSTAEIGRVMVRAQSRGASALQALVGAACHVAAVEHRVDACFLTCLSGLVSRYRRIGFRPYAAPLIPGVDGLTVPLVLVFFEPTPLERLGSFLAPVLEVCRKPQRDHAVHAWAPLFRHEALPVQFDSSAILRRIRQDDDATRPGSAFLRALDDRTVRKLVEHGFVISVRAGQLLTRQGLVQRELFVVIDGTFEIRDEKHHHDTVGPGEVVGEIGFFGSAHRRSATVIAKTDAQVMVIHRGWLNALKESDPRAAAGILFELARVLADRMYDTRLR